MHRLRLLARVLCRDGTLYIYIYFFLFASDYVSFYIFLFFLSLMFLFRFCFRAKIRERYIISLSLFLSIYLSISLFLSFVRQFLSIYTSWNTVCIKYVYIRVCICIYTHTVHATCALTPSCVSVWYTCYTLDTTPVNVLSKVWIMRSER